MLKISTRIAHTCSHPRCSRPIIGRRLVKALASATFGDDNQKFSETLKWARATFSSRVNSERPDDSIPLALSALLIAVEDEAAAELFYENNPPLLEQAVLRRVRSQGTKSERVWEKSSGMTEAPMLGAYVPSTWSLARLDNLADEVVATLRHNSHSNDGSLTEEASAGAHSLQDPEAMDFARMASNSEASTSGTDESIDRLREHVKAFPMQTIDAVNQVLFTQHGYQCIAPEPGDPRSYQLPHVMERGGGSPIALTILYLEVCARVGLPMHAKILEEGRYTVLWPQEAPLLMAGEEVVIDVFSAGSLFLLNEVRQLFDIEGHEPLQAASTREILCALLGGIRDAHWCKAVGCAISPSLMTPISVDTALSGTVPVSRNYQTLRAVAAAERACLVYPESMDLKLKLAVLLYFAHKFEDSRLLLRGLPAQHGVQALANKLGLLSK